MGLWKREGSRRKGKRKKPPTRATRGTIRARNLLWDVLDKPEGVQALLAATPPRPQRRRGCLSLHNQSKLEDWQLELLYRALHDRGAYHAGKGEVRFCCPNSIHVARKGRPDRNPSAEWNEEKGVWRCWSCGWGGTTLGLYRALEAGTLPAVLVYRESFTGAPGEQRAVVAAIRGAAKRKTAGNEELARRWLREADRLAASGNTAFVDVCASDSPGAQGKTRVPRYRKSWDDARYEAYAIERAKRRMHILLHSFPADVRAYVVMGETDGGEGGFAEAMETAHRERIACVRAVDRAASRAGKPLPANNRSIHLVASDPALGRVAWGLLFLATESDATSWLPALEARGHEVHDVPRSYLIDLLPKLVHSVPAWAGTEAGQLLGREAVRGVHRSVWCRAKLPELDSKPLIGHELDLRTLAQMPRTAGAAVRGVAADARNVRAASFYPVWFTGLAIVEGSAAAVGLDPPAPGDILTTLLDAPDRLPGNCASWIGWAVRRLSTSLAHSGP